MKISRIIPKPRGFSLVEVTLAVAIASLGIITLLGLLPQGLAMSQRTSLLVTNSNIVEQVIRDIENAKFSTLPVALTRKYYDAQGNEVKVDSKNISYVAEIDPRRAATLPKAEATQLYLKRMIIHVAATGNPEFKFADTNRLSYVTFNHLVAKTR